MHPSLTFKSLDENTKRQHSQTNSERWRVTSKKFKSSNSETLDCENGSNQNFKVRLLYQVKVREYEQQACSGLLSKRAGSNRSEGVVFGKKMQSDGEPDVRRRSQRPTGVLDEVHRGRTHWPCHRFGSDSSRTFRLLRPTLRLDRPGIQRVVALLLQRALREDGLLWEHRRHPPDCLNEWLTLAGNF